MNKILICILFLFLIIPFSSALSITGPVMKMPIRFEPNYEQEITYYVGEYTGQVRAHPLGDLADYITLSTPVEEGNRVRIDAKIKLPSKIEKPGLNTMIIKFEDSPTLTGMISARIVIEKVIVFQVLYSYKNAEVSFSIPNVNINEPIKLIVSVKSLSELNINSVNAVIEVYDLEDNLLDTLETETQSLPSGESISFSQTLDSTNYIQGTYKAKTTVFWDENQTNAETSFKIGDLSIGIKSYTKEFVKDAINKFNVDVESEWNEQIESSFAELYINNEKVMTTPTITLPAWNTVSLQGYFDTTGYDIGEHDAKLIIHFDGESTMEEFTAMIVESTETNIDRQKAGEITFVLNTTTTLSIIIILIVIGNIIYFYFQKKKQTNKEQKSIKKAKK